MARAIKVLFNKILVKVEKGTERVGSLYVARIGDEEGPIWGTVTEVGDGTLEDDGSITIPRVAIGDRVLFNTFDSALLKWEGQEYRVLPETSVLVVEVDA